MASAAENKIARNSGAFRVQIGVDENSQPVFSDCGRLNLYKTDGGREWRLEDTCEELIDVMLPTVTPTPTPGGPITPTPTPPTNTPKPTTSGSNECPDGFFSKINNVQWTLTNVTLQQGKDHVWCADLPASRSVFFEINTTNKGNASCSDVEMTVTSPTGAEYFSNGSQPGVPPFTAAGRWKVKMHLNEGCARYDVNILYY